MKEEDELQMSEYTVVSKISGFEGDKFSGKFRKLHNKELYDIYKSPGIMRKVNFKRLQQTEHEIWMDKQ
jgi:hypothetical protein